MPHCESCHVQPPAVELHIQPATNKVVCAACDPEVLPAGTILGREFDYDFSYSKKDGFRASASLGKATLSLHVPQEELIKVLG